MKKITKVLLLNLFILGSISAQNFNPKFRISSDSITSEKFSSDSLHILAVMVEFAEDRDTETFGNGKFGTIYSKDYGNDILDPLPHDKPYFADHLTFVKNYFEKVSNGNLGVSFSILPDIITVSGSMRNYSPPSTSVTFDEVGALADEVWRLADSLNQGFDFSNYNMFVIFHAGVSRGLVTPGSIGLERDIPSLYLGINSLKKIMGDQFEGFSVSNGNFKITNTAVMPETDSRELDGITGKTLIQLTTNGLLCTTVANFLGVPDLFDTETGKSAIGRFGLMDPQGFYAYQGIFPPEPSPWVKVFLGWETPVTLNLQNVHQSLTAQRVTFGGDTTLIKVPINADEYYLIENRSRDARKDGAKITYKVGGQIITKTFPFDVDHFRFFNVDTIKGVVIDIDEPDWAVPGIDRNDVDGEFKDVGLVIWHIDQKVIDENLASNRINADIKHRGIFIEEADGIFDIGNDFQNILTGSVETREAFKADTWYSSNPSKLYTNVFDAQSKPSTITNSGANSYISFSNFSKIAQRMSFDIAFGGDEIKPLMSSDIPNFTPSWLSIPRFSRGELFLTGNERGDVKQLGNDGSIIDINNFSSKYQPAIYGVHIDTYVMIGSSSDSILVYYDGITYVEKINSEITTPVSISDYGADAIRFYFGTSNGKIFKYSFPYPGSKTITKINEIQAFASTEKVTSLLLNGDDFFAFSQSELYDFNGNTSNLGDSVFIKNAALTKDESNNYVITAAFNKSISGTLNSGIFIIKNGVVENIVNDAVENDISYLSLADMQSDGNNYIIYKTNYDLHVINLQGSESDYFPVQLSDKNQLSTNQLIIDLNMDGKPDIITTTTNGNIFAVSGKDGSLINGFPISIGSKLNVTPIIFKNSETTVAIAAITVDGYFSVWNISNFNAPRAWSGKYVNSGDNNFVDAASKSNIIEEYFPADRAYNWPNPIYGNSTQIRFYVAEDSKANVKIFDLGGELVAELSADAVGNLDNEITWNVNNIQSGVYLANLNVVSNSGRNSSSKIIKIVVIK